MLAEHVSVLDLKDSANAKRHDFGIPDWRGANVRGYGIKRKRFGRKCLQGSELP
jgi:hypothetical protein